jgi:hypothetical protein
VPLLSLVIEAILAFGALDAAYIAGAVAFIAIFIEGPSIRFLADRRALPLGASW